MFGCLSILWRNFYPHSNIGLLYIFVHILHRFHLPLCRVKIKTAKKKAWAIFANLLLGLCSQVRQLFKTEQLYCLFSNCYHFKNWQHLKKKKKHRIKQTFFNWSVCSLETQQILIYLSIFGFKSIFRLSIPGSRLLALWSMFSSIVSHLQKSLLLPFPLKKKKV